MRFTKEIGLRYIGRLDRAWISYAADEDVRAGAASGGVVSALLLHLLDTGRIDGAIVTQIDCSQGRIGCKVVLARNPRDVLDARTSKYVDVPLVSDGLNAIEAFDGNVAVVALPCHTAAFRRLAERRPELGAKIKYIITLFCGHCSHRALLDGVLAGKGIDQSCVTEFAFRRGRWRGHMTGTLADGSSFAFPFKHFSMYHNLNFFCLPRCLACHDHTGYQSDFSVGDAWLREMKAEPIKHSMVLARNPEATQIIQQMVSQNKLVARPTDQATVFRSQKRSLIYHYNVTARAQVGKRYGIAIKDTVKAKVRWNDWLAAHIIMINYRLSHRRATRDWILRMPRPVTYAYMLLLKFLQNF